MMQALNEANEASNDAIAGTNTTEPKIKEITEEDEKKAGKKVEAKKDL